MDKRLLLAVVLSVLVVVGYQEYLRIYYPQPAQRPAATPRAAEQSAPVASPVAAVPPQAPDVATEAAPRSTLPVEADVVVETDLFVAKLSSRGARLVSFALKDYRSTVDPASPPLDLVSSEPTGELPLGIVLRGEKVTSDRDVAYRPSTTTARVSGEERSELVFQGALPGGGAITKRLRFHGSQYAFEVGVDLPEPPAGTREVALSWVHRQAAPAQDSHYVGAEALVGRKLLYLDETKLAEGAIFPDPRDASAATATPQWAGYADSYFLSAIAPNFEESVRLWLKLDGGAVTTEVLLPLKVVAGEAPEYTVYAGPKDLDHLTPAGHHLQRALDLGWFGILAELLLRVLKFFHRFTSNYGVDIILLTVLIKVLFIPLTRKSYESMQGLQRLQPEMKRLQERFKDDREALNKEMMELYRRHKVNPLGGCLPMLLQMPVFIGLYNALFYAVELRHAPFALWINDLSVPDRLPALTSPPLAQVFGVDVRIPVLTLLMGVSMLVQQKMTPPAGDPAQQRMMMFMPVVFTVMFVSFPAGLVLYWLVNNVLTIAQQAMMQRSAKK